MRKAKKPKQPRTREEQVSYYMSRIRSKGTKIEKRLGSYLWASGIRYRKHYSIEGKPDFAIPSLKIAIFCDSSFWHGRNWGDEKKREFKTHADFWIPKIDRNIERDHEVNETLEAAGWTVLRFWEDEIVKQPDKCVARVLEAIEHKKRRRDSA